MGFKGYFVDLCVFSFTNAIRVERVAWPYNKACK